MLCCWLVLRFLTAVEEAAGQGGLPAAPQHVHPLLPHYVHACSPLQSAHDMATYPAAVHLTLSLPHGTACQPCILVTAHHTTGRQATWEPATSLQLLQLQPDLDHICAAVEHTTYAIVLQPSFMRGMDTHAHMCAYSMFNCMNM